MKVRRIIVPLGLLTLFLCVPVSLFAKKSLSNFQMRLHIYQTHWNHNRYGYHAFGRANLFDEKGVPHGVEFTYDCADHLMASTGREAYPAKWKKQGQTIDVVFGEIGAKAGQFHDCEFKVSEKQFVYFGARGGLGTESAQDFIAKRQNQTPTIGAATQADVPDAANSSNTF